jgi:hypothetical protein
MSPRTWVLGSASLLLACTPSLSAVVVSDTFDSPIALFAPNAASPCESVVPFPTDLARNADGTLSIPDCPGDDATTKATKVGLRTLDGWSLTTTIYTPVSKALDPNTLVAGVTVLLVDTSIPAPVEATVSFMPTGAPVDNALVIKPVKPLADGTLYSVIVTTGVKGTNGKPLVSDQIYTLAKSTTPLVDAHGFSTVGAISNADANALEPLRAGLKPMFDGMAAGGIQRKDIAIAWVFTTQKASKTFAGLSQLVGAVAPVVSVDSAILAREHPLLVALGPIDSLGCVYNGRIKLTNLITSSGTFGVTAAGHPVTSSLAVQYLFTAPASAACGADWTTSGAAKVAIFAHGLGRCKNDALALANNLAKAGYATLALDGPLAGTRTLENLGDQNLDGCPDQPATPELITIGSADPNPFAIRDEMREWGLELVQAAGVAGSNPWAFAGVTAPSGGVSTVSLVGHSWGGIAAVLAGSTAGVTTVVTSASGAGFGPMFAPLLEAGIAAKLTAAGVDITSAQGAAMLSASLATAVSTYAWVLEGADPLYFAGAYPSTRKVLTQVVSSGGGAVQDLALHGTDAQVALARAFDAGVDTATSKYVFNMVKDGTSVCDDSETMLGMLLQPCSAAGLVAAHSGLAGCLAQTACFDTAAAQLQLGAFIASGGALTCTLLVDCPNPN